MRRAVGAEKERGVARGRGAAQGAAMRLALGDRQAIEMRPDAALKDRIAVDDQMMRGDRRRQIEAAILDIADRLLGRDVLEHDAQFRQPAAQGVEHALDKHRLPVENIDFGIGHLAMDQEGHADRGHALQHRHHPIHVGDPVRGMRRRMRRVELDRGEHALLMAARHLGGIGRVGQIAGHQRREIRALRERRQNPLAIAARRRDIGHRRHQIGHDDRARELARGPRQDRPQHRAVAEMDMPIVRPADRDRVGSWRHRQHRGHPNRGTFE